MEMKKFPKIGQYRNAVKVAQHHDLGEVEYVGTVKLHGTNASIVIKPDGYYFQSRNNILHETKDNAGWHKFASTINWDLPLKDTKYSFEEFAVYGEWCGGNIQKGVALSQLPKMFVVFAIKHDDRWISPMSISGYVDLLGQEYVKSIYEFPCAFRTVDMSRAQASQNYFKELVDQVEAQCPVGKELGSEGTGEGLVWTPVDGALRQYEDLWFKTKGAKHSASKVRTVAEVDIVRLGKVWDFIEYSVTDNRLNQGLEYLSEQGLERTIQNTGKFISWVFNDINTEEADIISENNFSRKEISTEIGKKTREWYHNYLDKEAGVA